MGGVKVVHEYANRLSEKGHFVTLIYPIHLQTNFRYFLKKFLVNQYDRYAGNSRELYYTPNPKVSVLMVKNICDKYIPNADAIIAVGWQTAGPVANLSYNCGKKFYFLQSFETYFKNKQQIIKTYHLPLIKIAISNWIIEELRNIGENAEGRIPNAINPAEFFLENETDQRPTDIITLYHPAKIKGAEEVLTVLKNLGKKIPQLSATFIAARHPICSLPSWINVVIRPSIAELRLLYNHSKIYLHTSHWEGWPLPVMEAMACGCAVVATENRGVKEYLVHENNALMSPIGNTAALATQVNHLLENDKHRKSLVENGLKTVKQFSWESSVAILENILLRNT